MTMRFLATILLAWQAPAPAALTPLTLNDVLNRWDAGFKLIDSYDIQTVAEDYSYLQSKNNQLSIIPAAQASPPRRSYAHIYRSGEKRRGEFGGV